MPGSPCLVDLGSAPTERIGRGLQAGPLKVQAQAVELRSRALPALCKGLGRRLASEAAGCEGGGQWAPHARAAGGKG